MRSCLLWAISTLAASAGPQGEAAHDQSRLPEPIADEVVPIAFTTRNGWQYDGRIELPPQERRRDWAVMMLGGGLGGPMDWLVPGELTIDGKPTRNGDTIARALLEEGFIVMRWHSIRRGDPLNAKDPLMMDSPPPQQTFEQAKLAFDAFHAKGIVREEHIFMLGHSLGASRACTPLAEHRKLAGVVMLAGAGLIPSDLDAAREVVRQASANPSNDGFKTRGFDNVHEWRVHRLQETHDRWVKETAGARDRWGHRWAADLIVEYKTPTLLVVGALDERWLMESYLFTIYLRGHKHPDYGWKVYDGAGHNLAPEEPGAVTYKDQGEIASARVGPIDPQVVKDVVDWLTKRAQ